MESHREFSFRTRDIRAHPVHVFRLVSGRAYRGYGILRKRIISLRVKAIEIKILTLLLRPVVGPSKRSDLYGYLEDLYFLYNDKRLMIFLLSCDMN